MSNKQLVTVAQMGSRMHYAVPAVFASVGQLQKLYTDFYWRGSKLGENIIMKWGGGRLRRMIERSHPEIPPNLVASFDWLGIKYQLALSRAKTFEETERIFIDYGRYFAQEVANHGFHGAKFYYGFSQGALETLEKAQEEGVIGLLEQMSIPSDLLAALYAQEYMDWPDWEPSDRLVQMHTGIASAREMAEWQAADQIIVGSEFASYGLQRKGVCSDKIRVIPYGINLQQFSPTTSQPDAVGPLRVLYVGLVSVRKGIPYLFQALQALRRRPGLDIEVKCVGTVELTQEAARELGSVCELTGQMPRSTLPKLYQWADVFVFPSVCEGSATVIYEALASGLPVITTPNAGSIVRDGIDGYIVPIRDASALAEKIERLALDSQLREQFSRSARQRANFGSLDAYRQRLLSLLVDNKIASLNA